MLVLSRREGETVNIYDASGVLIAVVMVTECKDGNARLGFEADRSIRIMRGEVSDERASRDPSEAVS